MRVSEEKRYMEVERKKIRIKILKRLNSFINIYILENCNIDME